MKMSMFFGWAGVAASSSLLSACATLPVASNRENAALMPDHAAFLTLDTHLDTPVHFDRTEWSFADKHGPETDLVQVDIPRMDAGALDGGFFAIYTAQGPLTKRGYADALAFARKRSDSIDRTVAAFPQRIGSALTSSDAIRLNESGRLIAFKSMENSYPLGESLALLSEFHDRGVRLASPVHGGTNQFADSATDSPRWNGLSPLGRQWVAEMNRLGMVIDASHASDTAFDQMIELSTAPLLLSHSSAKWAFDHPRNLDDARIRKLAQSGGAICVSSIYMSRLNLDGKRSELFDKFDIVSDMSAAEQLAFSREWHELGRTQPLWEANFEQYMDMVLHVIDIAGVDHVCFAGDWDGGGGFEGFDDIADLPKVTKRLKAAGFSDQDVAKMWSGNVLRILNEVEAAAK